MNIKRYREALSRGILDVMPDGQIFIGVKNLNIDAYGKILIGNFKGLSVHVLVALAFIPNPDDFRFVKRVNDDPSDPKYNHKDNLYWAKSTYTKKRSTANTDIYSNVKIVERSRVLTNRQIWFIRASDKPYRVLAKQYSCHYTAISRIKKAQSYANVKNSDGSTYIPADENGLKVQVKLSRSLTVDDIYKILESKESALVLSDRYNVTTAHIGKIKAGKTLKAITVPWLKAKGLYVEP
jgi:hypothetical protein